MFIQNSHMLENNPNFYKCKKNIGKYLERNGFPVLSKTTDDEYYYFTNNNQLTKAIEKMPFWLRIFK